MALSAAGEEWPPGCPAGGGTSSGTEFYRPARSDFPARGRPPGRRSSRKPVVYGGLGFLAEARRLLSNGISAPSFGVLSSPSTVADHPAQHPAARLFPAVGSSAR